MHIFELCVHVYMYLGSYVCLSCSCALNEFRNWRLQQVSKLVNEKGTAARAASKAAAKKPRDAKKPREVALSKLRGRRKKRHRSKRSKVPIDEVARGTSSTGSTEEHKNKMWAGSSNVIVAVRIRPMNTRERRTTESVLKVLDSKVVVVLDPSSKGGKRGGLGRKKSSALKHRSREKQYAFDHGEIHPYALAITLLSSSLIVYSLSLSSLIISIWALREHTKHIRQDYTFPRRRSGQRV